VYQVQILAGTADESLKFNLKCNLTAKLYSNFNPTSNRSPVMIHRNPRKMKKPPSHPDPHSREDDGFGHYTRHLRGLRATKTVPV
jgi:hypothetical protein